MKDSLWEVKNKYMEPKSKSYSLPEGFMERYENEVKKIGKMSDILKYMYVRVGREQFDILHRELNNITNKSAHKF